MEATELRIGNLVDTVNYGNGITSANKQPMWIQSIELHSVELCNINDSIHDTRRFLKKSLNDIIPIPLTEEWLLKFGFESYDGEIYNPDCEYSEQFLYQLKSGISYREFRCFPSKGWVVKIGDYNDDLEIKFVHQLQNIYFALIGEELTIKQLA